MLNWLEKAVATFIHQLDVYEWWIRLYFIEFTLILKTVMQYLFCLAHVFDIFLNYVLGDDTICDDLW